MICISVQDKFIYETDCGMSECYLGEASDRDVFNRTILISIPEKKNPDCSTV